MQLEQKRWPHGKRATDLGYLNVSMQIGHALGSSSLAYPRDHRRGFKICRASAWLMVCGTTSCACSDCRTASSRAWPSSATMICDSMMLATNSLICPGGPCATASHCVLRGDGGGLAMVRSRARRMSRRLGIDQSYLICLAVAPFVGRTKHCMAHRFFSYATCVYSLMAMHEEIRSVINTTGVRRSVTST